MASLGEKQLEADALMKKGSKLWAPSLLDFRLKPDWEAAAPLFERAALLYKQCGQTEKALDAYERAAQSQENIGSVWHAAKHLETCGVLSRELAQPDRTAEFYRQAGSYFSQAGRISAAAAALARGAKALEEAAPHHAASLYGEALELYESDGKAGQASDTYRAAAALAVKRCAWADAAGCLLRFGEACDRVGAAGSQAKAYLGAALAWLVAGDAQQAWQVYQDVLGVESFARSEEAAAADALFAAYRGGDAGQVKAVVQAKPAFKHLDNQLARLALKLPAGGDLAAMARQLDQLAGGRAGGAGGAGEDDEELL